MNNLLFEIIYRSEEPENAILHTWCKASELGEGLKDILLYLKNSQKSGFETESAPEGYFKCYVYDGKEDIKELSGEEIVRRLEIIRDAFKSTGKIEGSVRMQDYDFVSSDIEKTCDKLILSVESAGVDETIKKQGDALNLVFNKAGKGVIPQRAIIFEHQNISFKEILRVMDDIFTKLPADVKKGLGYEIDFRALTYQDYPVSKTVK